jgi:hypothetical protein
LRKNIRVFSWDSNPRCDSPSFFVSRHEAECRVSKRCARFVAHNAIQHRPPDGLIDATGRMLSALFDEAWAPQWSEAFIVWQMRKDET